MARTNEAGFHTLLVLLLVVVLGGVGAIGYFVLTKSQNKTSAEVRWNYDNQQDKWVATKGVAPNCKDPFIFDYTPVDMNLASSVGFPGTYRGKSYKVHGTFALTESTEVKLPAAATLSGLTRYYEGDPAELQYLVSFETDCGIAFYFDHLHTLSPQLQDIAEKQPAPKLNDTRTNPSDTPPRIKLNAGDVIATATGAHLRGNYGIDFGVIDYRQRNKISSNPEWVKLHSTYKASEWYGACWFDMLPGPDNEKAKQLSRVQANTQRIAEHVSDYCDNADYKTLDFKNGQPVDYY